ncbi:MAG: phosphoribosyltransferase [Cyanobacteria bacterium SID2]|nr:phosphoribosyltransferase [Cyanobacteria bacterium SID2]MBP0004908.1 phosphoribosyltransferase [Cyanobacteria bacterium SBC]
MSDLYVSWTQYHQLIERLAANLYQSGWKFDRIVCIARGGVRVGDILSRVFQCPLAILATSSYGGTEGRERGAISIAEHLTMSSPMLGKRVLLVDDLVDSGESLKVVLAWLLDRYGSEIEEIRTAVLWYKACGNIQPDYYVEYLPDNPWIHQPFECYEQMSPASLLDRYRED